jgi:hypothetical protein
MIQVNKLDHMNQRSVKREEHQVMNQDDQGSRFQQELVPKPLLSSDGNEFDLFHHWMIKNEELVTPLNIKDGINFSIALLNP